MNQPRPELMRRFEREAVQPFKFPLHFDATSLLLLCSCLQLAARHPALPGNSRRFIDQTTAAIIDHFRKYNFPACAELAELGSNPDNDIII